MAERIDANLQVWQARTMGDKPQPTVWMAYYSVQSNPPEYRIVLANHRYYTLTNAQPTGRIQFVVNTAYWQGDKLQAKEIFNSDPLSVGQDTAVDVGWSNLHGFKVESIVPAGERHILIRVNGTGLAFADTLELIDLIHPVAV